MKNGWGGLFSFFWDWAHGDFVLSEYKFPSIEDVWPQGGEIAEAISENPQSGFSRFGRPITCEELVADLYNQDYSIIEWKGGRYPSDYEWQNDMHFVIRYVVGSFVAKYEDLNADSLARFIDFVGVGPVNQAIVEQVIRDYSETNRDYLTYVEQTELTEDWFSGKLRLMESHDEFEALDSL